MKIEDVIAWKNEQFNFTVANIKNIMKEVARWYDVQIEYKGPVDGLNFGGKMSRQKNVSELLKRLEATHAVKFEVEGAKITVVKVLQRVLKPFMHKSERRFYRFEVMKNQK